MTTATELETQTVVTPAHFKVVIHRHETPGSGTSVRYLVIADTIDKARTYAEEYLLRREGPYAEVDVTITFVPECHERFHVAT